MGMTMTAAYVFLAVTMAPALVQQGLNPVAVHLFIMYWAMLSFITPPVAIGAYAAASIAHTSFMRTGFEAMRFGAVKYVLPFFFVLNPILVAQDVTPGPFVLYSAGAVAGIALLSYALQGYLPGVGSLADHPLAVAVRGVLVVAGLLVAAPEAITTLVGFAVAALTYGVLLGGARLRRRIVLAPRPEPGRAVSG
jgi:TRAP-type uncharacterized transport system fused permease subunit